jgi:putative N6-adenine-specific DNA methylase
MKGLVTSYEGAEDIVKSEVIEIIGKRKTETKPSVVIFEATREDLFKLSYMGQSFSHCFELIDSFEISEFEDLDKIKDFDFSEFKDKKFRTRCLRIGDHNFNSSDVEREVGGFILDKVECKVNLDNPERVLFIYIHEDQCYVGIDWNNLDLSKRDYNAYPHSKSIKGTLAYIMLKLAGYTKNKVLLDPFCLSGIVPLEAAFYATKLSLNYFRKKKFLFVQQELVDDKFFEKIDLPFPSKKEKIHAFDYELKNITAVKHNAKIGEIDKALDIRKVEAEWIDMKFEETSVDLIVTAPLSPTFRNEKHLSKRYQELFYNAEYVLKKGGKLVIKENKLSSEFGDKSKLNLVDTKILLKGNSSFSILIFEKV